MKINRELIGQSDLLAIIVEKICAQFREDISLLVCYGSFVTGGHGRTSDIDFFFVPKTEKGFALNHQFILNNIGYDLWAVTWERLKRIANLEDQPASILMDGVTVYSSSDEDERRLEELKTDLLKNLEDESVTKRISQKSIQKAKAAFFDLQNCSGDRCLVDAIQIVETLLIAVAMLNGTYVRKGLKQIETEQKRWPLNPQGFLENYHKLIQCTGRADVQLLVKQMIVATEQLWKSRFEYANNPQDPQDLTGFYEEFKSAYNKLLLACENEDYVSAYYAGFMIDRETQSFLTRFSGSGRFPNMLEPLITGDFLALQALCQEHERTLVGLLHENNIQITTYQDTHDFSTKWGGTREPGH